MTYGTQPGWWHNPATVCWEWRDARGQATHVYTDEAVVLLQSAGENAPKAWQP